MPARQYVNYRKGAVVFKFKVSGIETLAGAGVGVVRGTALAGHVITGQVVTFMHDGNEFSLEVVGVVMGTTGRGHSRATELSLSVKLRQPAFALLRLGDELMSASPATSALRPGKVSRQRRGPSFGTPENALRQKALHASSGRPSASTVALCAAMKSECSIRHRRSCS
jgi:hypothetical protein